MRAGNAEDDFSLGVYGKHLHVHSQKEWCVSPRLADLELALRTWTEARDPESNNVFSKKTDIASATLPFDMANIVPSPLLFGHLGNHIIDSHLGQSLVEKWRWTALLESEIPENFQGHLSPAQSKLCKKLQAQLNKLPPSLSPMQRLSLTPVPFLTSDKFSLLKAQFGTNEVLRSMKDQQLWPAIEDKSKYTLEYVKTHTCGWTVGPFDFCGHAHVIGEGARGQFKGLCFWHQDMTDKKKLLMKHSWDVRSQYPEGMHKLNLASLEAEKKWRQSRKKQIQEAILSA
ncbi:hypothetical protein B0H17DRAFT_1140009 [Mycena rosella]|uniref:Uncharacterized protein n=1 Tax=Mycena rosella TaxID=1033263 RepID=A0AAD7D2Y5_MYCRO|nr:hypothetical protein B0H17DRAFT_1140009 [Mycena rosella]